MITSIFINALGQALFESCGQALVIYITLQIAMQLFPAMGSRYRYDINYLGLVIICCWFLANLAAIYLHTAALARYTPNYSNSHHISYHVPTLLQRAEAFIILYAKYITGLYLIGLTLHTFKLLGGLVHIRQIRKQENLRQNSVWSAKMPELRKKLPLLKNVQLFFSAYVKIPLTIGHFKPIVIFPLALINHLDNEQVEAILMHELAHIKRHDYLLNILQCLMETLLCFNPFVWLISKNIRQEREYCCDDMVIDEECNNFSYAKALFIIAQQNSQNHALAMAAAGGKPYPLLNRIKRLTTMKTSYSLPKFHLVIVISIACIGALLAWGIPQYSLAKASGLKKPLAAVKRAAFSAPAHSKNTKAGEPLHTPKGVMRNTDTTANIKLNDSTLNPSAPKFTIVIHDNGSKKEYNSITELPAGDKEAFLKENPSLEPINFSDSIKLAASSNLQMSLAFKKQMEDVKAQLNGPEFKKQIADLHTEMKKQFDSPAWKAKMEALNKQADALKAQFDNPETRAKMEAWNKQADELKARFDSPEAKAKMEAWNKQAEEMKRNFNNSPEWKKQHAEMMAQAKTMAMQFNSPEWKKSVADMQLQAKKIAQQFNSPGWKIQMQELQKQIQQALDDQNKAVQDSLKQAR